MKLNNIFRLLPIILSLIAFTGCAQQENNKNSIEMKKENQSKEIVAAFFNAFGKGDYEGILSVFDGSVKIVAVRSQEPDDFSPYGVFNSTDGLKLFLSNLGKLFDTKAFSVDNIIGEGQVAFANGSFTHQLKSTGKLFTSQWALMCTVEDGKITEFNFYEDSQKFSEANSQQ